MIKNYFKIAIRTLLKRKKYSLLNILGLTIGLTSCLLIFHYVSYEKSYDQHIPDNERVYRLRLDNYLKGEAAWKSATVFPAIAPTLKRDFAEIESSCRLIDAEMLLTNDNNQTKFTETKGYYAENSIIDMFAFHLISGNPKNALTGPGKMIISEKMAKKYFGDEPAIGKLLIAKHNLQNFPFQITGVFKNYCQNSHLTIEYLSSFDTFKMIMDQYGDRANMTETLFDEYDFYTYLKFKPGTNIANFESKLPAYCNKYMEQDHANKTYYDLKIIPVKDIHLYSNYNQEAEVNGNGQMVSFLFMIAIFIIFIAWINYVNLSTARSLERAKEVGVKKVLGAFRSDLIKQFLVENIILNVISLITSMIFFSLLLSSFDLYTGRNEPTDISLNLKYWQLFILLFIVGTFLSGLYPAFILSGFQPIKILKGSFKNSSKGNLLRKGLIVFQFTTSVILIAGTIIIYQQINYMRNKNLGASINEVIVLKGAGSIKDSVYKNIFQAYKNKLLQQPNIKKIAASTSVPGREIYSCDGVMQLGAPKSSDVTIYTLRVDFDFAELYNMKFVAGRNFSRDIVSDKNRKVLINESSAKLLGFVKSEDAINKKLLFNGSNDTVTVLGVLANYHQQGLQKAIEPLIISLSRGGTRSFYSIKLTTDNFSKNISLLEKIWKQYFPNDPFEYFFLDETFNQQYKADILFGKVFGIFAFLAIFIACSGLLGLSAYNVIQRTKEIGIRKVLGASVNTIVLLLSKDFLKLIIISLIIAFPIGWYVMSNWLQDYAYRISISAWVFILSGIISLLIALITISSQAIKAALANPTKSLRTE